MDKLAREAMLAREAGMTYGKWKALQPKEEKPKGIPDGWIRCKCCGKPFKPLARLNIFCEIGCREEYYRDNHKAKKAEYMEQYRAEKKKQEK